MQFKKRMGTASILLAAISGMVGSGWLFSALYAAQMAGPAAIVSWILAGVFVMIIALTFAEVSTLFPIAGGIANYSFFTHGKLAGFLMGWVSWLSFVVLTPIEVQASLQYATNFLPQLMTNHHLTLLGYTAAFFMMGLLVFINSLGISSTTKASNFFSTWKLIIPGLAILTYIMHSKDMSNLNNQALGGFAPYGLHGIFSALAVAGVVFSFNGFQVAILMASETKNPQKSIPRAIIGSILIGIILYGLLQFSFLLAIPQQFIASGWHQLSFKGDAGPLAGLATVIGASTIASLLYVDAVVAPMSAGLVYVTSTSRILYSLSANGYVHKSASQINKRGIPMKAIWINFVIGMLAFLPFPGWQSMVAFLSSIMVATYAIVPICLVTLRKQHPNLKRPFNLPLSSLFGFVAFYLCNLMLYWTGFDTLIKLFSCLVIGIIVYCLSVLRKKEWKAELPSILKSMWLVVYFGGMCAIGFLGSFGNGLNLYKHNIEYLFIGIFSAFIIKLAKISGISQQQSNENINSIVNKNNG